MLELRSIWSNHDYATRKIMKTAWYHILEYLTIMLALCLMPFHICYAQHYAAIIGTSLIKLASNYKLAHCIASYVSYRNSPNNNHTNHSHLYTL